MRKIRDFNLRLHFKETRRRLRKAADLHSLGLGDDQALAGLFKSFEESLKPAVIFETFGPESWDTAGFSPIPGVAHTLGLATLGPAAGRLVESARAGSEERGKVFETMAQAALDQAVAFVLNLLKDEVEAERCDLSPIQILSEAEALKAVVDRLEGEKIEVSAQGGVLAPPHSVAFCLSWIARRRGSKAAKAPASKK